MINVVIYTDGDPHAIEPDFIEEILGAHGLDVYGVEVLHTDNVVKHWGL